MCFIVILNNPIKNSIMKNFLLIISLLLSFSLFAQTDRQITVAVNISADVLPDNADHWTVYIYAALPNTRLPLAALRTTLDKLPLIVELKQAMFLLPTHTLNDFEQVVVSVTVSKNSDPHQHSAFDLIGKSPQLSFTDQAQIDTVVTVDRLDQRH